jgi:protein-serine/threonine kinase
MIEFGPNCSTDTVTSSPLLYDTDQYPEFLVFMLPSGRRPLPSPPGPPMGARPSPYSAPQDFYDEPSSGIPAGTFLHKGFYDLLAMIPTPSPSRLIWGTPPPPSDPVIAGPRYEDIMINPRSTAPTVRKGRRISKDMVSKPAGFVYVLLVNYIPSS